MSYAEIAAKGPKQTPEEVRAAKELFQQFLATGLIAPVSSSSGFPTQKTLAVVVAPTKFFLLHLE